MSNKKIREDEDLCIRTKIRVILKSYWDGYCQEGGCKNCRKHLHKHIAEIQSLIQQAKNEAYDEAEKITKTYFNLIIDCGAEPAESRDIALEAISTLKEKGEGK